MHKLTVWKLMPDKLETRNNLLQQGWLTIRTSHFWKQWILFFCSNSERIFSWQGSLFHKVMFLYTAVIDESISSLLQQFGLDVSSGLHIFFLWNEVKYTWPNNYSKHPFEGKSQTWEIPLISQWPLIWLLMTIQHIKTISAISKQFPFLFLKKFNWINMKLI